MARTRISKHKEEEVLSLLARGMKILEIQDTTGVYINSIYRIQKENNLQRNIVWGEHKKEKPSRQGNESSIKPMKKNIGHPVDSFMLDCF